MLRIALCAAALVLCAGTADAQQQSTFPDYVKRAPQASPPFLPTDLFPMVRGNKTYSVPGDSMPTGGGGGNGALPTTCGGSGAVDGAPWNNNGHVEVCSTTSLTMDGVPLEMDGVPITGL